MFWSNWYGILLLQESGLFCKKQIYKLIYKIRCKILSRETFGYRPWAWSFIFSESWEKPAASSPAFDVTKQTALIKFNDWASVSSDIFLQLESAICYALFTAGDKFIFMTVLFSQEKVEPQPSEFSFFIRCQ